MDELIRRWAVLYTVVQDMRDEMQHYSGVRSGVVRICGTRAWQDMQRVEQELWQQHRVRMIGMEGAGVRYSMRGVAQILAVEDWQLASGIEEYVERVAGEIDKMEFPG